MPPRNEKGVYRNHADCMSTIQKPNMNLKQHLHTLDETGSQIGRDLPKESQ